MKQLRSVLVLVTLASAARSQDEIHTVPGNAAGARYGFSIDGGVDFDNDGYDDLVIGAPYASAGGKTDNGVVRVISGQTHAAILTKIGDADGDHFGYAVKVCGDVNGDGTPDIIVGAPDATVGGVQTGMARVVSGATSATLFTWAGDAAGDKFGWSVDGGFDTNQDGRADLIVGAPTGNFNGLWTTGYARTFSGMNGAILFNYNGVSPGGGAGWAVAALNDIGNDGRRDFAVGVPAQNGAGVVIVFDGDSVTGNSSVLHTLAGTTNQGAFGVAIDGGFDADQDGRGDVIVGAYTASSPAVVNCGSATVFSGASGGVIAQFFGDATNDRFGKCVAVIGNVNMKPGREVLVGANGYARMFDAANGELMSTVVNSTSGEGLGSSVCDAGDFDDDGVRDFAVGASTASPNGLVNAGLCRVYSSRPWFVTYCTAGTTTNGCAAQIAASGSPSVAASSGFTLSASGVEGARTGLIFYGLSGRAIAQWGLTTSFLCVKSPTQRTTPMLSTGLANTCDGVIAVDWLAFLAANPSVLGAPPVAGQVVNAQCWFRDPPSPKTTHLSDALEFILVP